MVSTVVVLLLFVLVLYAYRNHNREFEATASAIREIWSGSCRLSCRENESSGVSGPLGLDKGQAQVIEPTYGLANQSNTDQTVPDCVCETCPCNLVENVLRTCRPATSLYNEFIELISSGYYNLVKAICDAGRIVSSGVSETGPGKSNLLSIMQVGSADNINFINQTAVKVEVEIKDPEQSQRKKGNSVSKKVSSPVQNKELELGQRKEIAFQDGSDAVILKDLPKIAATSQKASLNVKQSEATKDGDSKTSVGTISDPRSCSKCIEKGKVCMGNCPRAKDKENK
ncbi:uncharacterized protein LOC123868906 [Maniola jurtina]|uniref:uncharacterized protein LOC123868906 n=1 Tax=Maniola jurtina TaxID=191418 RepID=UPI001E68F25A|nr:uncharacterized protein LOC123868906 [Maniola jurtina]